MELFYSAKYKHLRITSCVKVALQSLLVILCVSSFSSCTDDAVLPESSGQSQNFGSIKVTNLPAYFGISLNQNSVKSTRADEISFNDGTADEYALADPEGAEYFHYLLVYGKSSTPIVFPLDITDEDKIVDNNTVNNITLTISKVITDSQDLSNQINWSDVKSSADLAQVFGDAEVYVLLNFQLKDNSNYSLNGGPVAGANTPAKLLKLTKSDLQKIRMLDYGITVSKVTEAPDGSQSNSTTGYFTMSNSVYSDGNKKIIDGSVDTSKFYPSLEEAKANPAISVYVERLASKISVSFDTPKMSEVMFGPIGDQAAQQVVIGNNGFPVITTTVNKVDMINSQNTGITFTDNGYKIMTEPKSAEITIIGFGLSNLEKYMTLFKDINAYYGTTWNWYDTNLHRSYWSIETNEHCALARTSNALGDFKKVNGYPHQFRLALDTDSVTSYHNGSIYSYSGVDNGYIYDTSKNIVETYKIGDTEYQSFAQLGEIDVDQRINGVFLNYKSYNTLSGEFQNRNLRYTVNGRKVTFNPIYTIENTYYDQGMLTNGVWRWPWHRAPYATATNLIVMAKIKLENTEENTTLYLGQNNIFYVKKTNLLRSKLAILNQVMLSGGNAGLQILHGQWDSHTRWEDGTNHVASETHLDKVAWNEGSVLWFAEVMTQNDEDPTKPEKDNEGNLLLAYEEKEGKDAEGNPIKYNQVKLKRAWQANVNNGDSDNADEQDLDLIPAEISGGDGQCLIAPNRKYMGAKYRYYLAPPKNVLEEDETGLLTGETKQVMDMDYAVEISYNHLVALIHKIIGPVDVYTNGLMYYSVPIPHRYMEYGPDKNTDAWKHFGAFSVVRNNWYDITINQITRLGTPIHDLDQPIVPVMDVKRSYLNMGVMLKDYHEVTQDNIPIM